MSAAKTPPRKVGRMAAIVQKSPHLRGLPGGLPFARGCLPSHWGAPGTKRPTH